MNIVCIAVTLLVGFLFSVSSAFSPQPGFDLTGSVGSSELIVTGHLNEDGTFVTSEIISGNKPTSGEVRLENSVLIAQKLKKELATKSAPEVVLFLNKIPGHSDFYLVPTCLVAFDDAGVPWAWLDDGSMAGNSLGKHPAKTKKNFPASMRTTLADVLRLREIIAMPRAHQRTELLIGFIRDHLADLVTSDWEGKPSLRNSGFYPSYFLRLAMDAFRKPTPEELDALFKAVESGNKETEQGAFFSILQAIGCPPALFERIKPWVKAEKGPLVRRIAFQAAVETDFSKGIDLLIPYLTPAEPQLRDVISTIGSSARDHRPQSKKLIAPLSQLSKQLLANFKASGSNEDNNRGRSILWTFGSIKHPSFVPLVWEWAMSETSVAGQAASDFRTLNWPQESGKDQAAATAWIEKNRGTLTRPRFVCKASRHLVGGIQGSR